MNSFKIRPTNILKQNEQKKIFYPLIDPITKEPIKKITCNSNQIINEKKNTNKTGYVIRSTNNAVEDYY